MTWAKFGTEFADECAAAGLSDAAYRTHAEAIGYLFRVESRSCQIAANSLPRLTTSHNRRRAVAQLVAVGFWRECPGGWQVMHHAEVIRESLDQQKRYRERNRANQQAYRDRATAKTASEAAPESDVSAYVSAPDNRHTTTGTNEHQTTGVNSRTRTSRDGQRPEPPEPPELPEPPEWPGAEPGEPW